MSTETATPAPKPTPPKKPGVYICKGCGIGEAVDADGLVNVAKSEFRVETLNTHDAYCSDEGVAAIRSDVDAGTVDGVVVAACSQRVMADRFRFNTTPVVRANLREQVAWTQKAGEEDTDMLAADQVRMAITQVKATLPPLPSMVQEYSRTVLVLGGGITGLTAAHEAAAAGHPVLLVEKTDQLGGWANKWAGRMPLRPPYRDVQDVDIAKLIAAVNGRQGDSCQDRYARGENGRPARLVHGHAFACWPGDERSNRWRHRRRNRLPPLRRNQARPSGLRRLARHRHRCRIRGDAQIRWALKRKSNGSSCQDRRLRAVRRFARSPTTCRIVQACAVASPSSRRCRSCNPIQKASAYIVYEELRTPGTAEEFYRQAQVFRRHFHEGQGVRR